MPCTQTTILLEKLLEIERSVGYDNLTIRGMLMDAEVHVLRLQDEMIALMQEMQNLREMHEGCAPVPGWSTERKLPLSTRLGSLPKTLQTA